MKEIAEYRTGLIEGLGRAAREFRDACLAIPDPHEALEPGGWNAHQVAVHTRDVHELVYGRRARRSAEEDEPVFQNFDGESYMEEHYDAGEPLGTLLDGLVGSVDSLVEFLQSLPAEAWSRPSSHATLGGGFYLQTWVERDLAHIREHLGSLRRS